ncbi:hypothetical protein L7F22_040883 [Adiantum nelumboides]|nr:hypothetical protein [Adiantum nelumboides]
MMVEQSSSVFENKVEEIAIEDITIAGRNSKMGLMQVGEPITEALIAKKICMAVEMDEPKLVDLEMHAKVVCGILLIAMLVKEAMPWAMVVHQI